MSSSYRKGYVFFSDRYCGIIEETETGYCFSYDDAYFDDPKSKSVSLTLPKTKKIYISSILFPFFDGLIPEGYLLDEVISHWNLKERDRFGILLKSSEDPIGAVSIKEVL